MAAEGDFTAGDFNGRILFGGLTGQRACDLDNLAGLQELSIDLRIELFGIRLVGFGAVIAAEINLVAVLCYDDMTFARRLSRNGAGCFEFLLRRFFFGGFSTADRHECGNK